MISKKYLVFSVASCFIALVSIDNVSAQVYRNNQPRTVRRFVPRKVTVPIASPTPDPIIEEQKIIKAKVNKLDNQINENKNQIVSSTEEINNLKSQQNELLSENRTVNEKNKNLYNVLIALIALLLVLIVFFVIIILKIKKNSADTIVAIRNQQLKNTEEIISERVKDFNTTLDDNYKTFNNKNLDKAKVNLEDFEKNISEMINKYIKEYSAQIDAENNKPEALEVKRYFNSIINKEKEISNQIERIHLSNTYFNAANTLMKSEYYSDAAEEYEEAIKANPNFYGAYLNLGKALEKLDEKEKAIKTYLKAVEINPDYYKAYYNLAHIYFETQKYDEAIENYQQVLKLNSDNYKAYNNLAIIYNFKGDKEKAKESYKKALEINKDYIEAYFNLLILEEADLSKDDNIYHVSALYTKKYGATPEVTEKVDKLLEAHIKKREILIKK